MILRSIQISGWRCFVSPVQVGPFSEGLNVLHAPNATGKSTLFEALLRGLLDGHRVSGREVEALQPWGRALSPTVTVEFVHGGADYRIRKRFLDSACSELERKENGRFVRLAEGEGADERVREILTRNPPGRGLARSENWGLAQILWAPQGNLALSKLSGDVMADIRASLGTQVAGPGVGPLEERIEEAYLQSYTPGGKLKTGKDAPALIQLRERLKSAIEKHRAALEAQQHYEEAARRVEEYRALRAQARHNAVAYQKELKEVRSQAESYKGLLSNRGQREERVKSAEVQHGALKQQIETIKTTRKELKDAQDTIRQLQEDVGFRTREVEEREKHAAQAKGALEDVRKGRQKVEKADQEAQSALDYLRHREKSVELGGHLRQIVQYQKNLEKRKKERSNLIAPDAKTLRAIRKAIKERDEAQVRLAAALITLEIVAEKKGPLQIVAGEEPGTLMLNPGVPTEVKGSPEVVVHLPGIARLRARGPSGSVEEVRDEINQAVRKLNELTKGFGTPDLERLEFLAEKARELDEKVAETETQIETLLSGEPVEKIEQEYKRITAILEEIIGSHPTWKENPPDAEGLLATAEEIKRSFISAVESTEAAWEFFQTAFAAAGKQKTELAVRLDETEKKAKSLESKITDLTSDGKTAEKREIELKNLALSWEAATASLDEIEAKLKLFQGDPHDAVTKLEKQLERADEAAEKALEKEKSEEGRLEHLSAQGPYSVLAQAEEEMERLKREVAREETRVAAIGLLRNIVAQCRAEALTAVTRPVEFTASRTLQRIAGGRLGRLQFGETFEPTHVLPESVEMSVPIESVSGGEREQIYLATRLALAEVLAKDERQLVVLDDVLIATDAGRLSRVMTIIEEAAQHLQILVLTCHPERYHGLDQAAFFDLGAILRDGPKM